MNCSMNIKYKIAEYLHYFDILCFLSTCKKYRKLFYNQGFWRYICIKKFQITLNECLPYTYIKLLFEKNKKLIKSYNEYIRLLNYKKYNNVVYCDLINDKHLGLLSNHPNHYCGKIFINMRNECCNIINFDLYEYIEFYNHAKGELYLGFHKK